MKNVLIKNSKKISKKIFKNSKKIQKYRIYPSCVTIGDQKLLPLFA